MKAKLFFIAGAALLAVCCKNNQRAEADEADSTCTCPPMVSLQPLGGFTKAEAEAIKKPLGAFLERNVAYDVTLLNACEPMPLGEELMNDAKTRYRGDKIIRQRLADASDHNYFIGLLHEDISCTYKGRDDWGVQGLTLHGTHACVVSTFRVKALQRDLWKVVAHELVHSMFNYGHCPKDSAQCIMQDAKGHPRLSGKRDLCGYCKEHVWDQYNKDKR